MAKIIETIGHADDLYCVECDGQIKSVGTVKLCAAKDCDEQCDLNITLTSFALNNKNGHKTIDKVVGHKIKFTLETIDDTDGIQTLPNPEGRISVVNFKGEKWVRVEALGEDFVIAPKDLDDSKAFNYDSAMARLKELGLDTFNRKQGGIISIYADEINAKLKEIGGDPMDKYCYVSKELWKPAGSVGEYSSYYSWVFYGYYRSLNYYFRSYSYFRSRPCMNYKPENN